MEQKKSLKKLIYRGLRHGTCRKMELNKYNISKLEDLKSLTRHSKKPQLTHLFNNRFTTFTDCYAFVSNTGDWLAAITVSRVNQSKVQAELLLRKKDAPAGIMEALIFKTAQFLSEQNYNFFSLGEVPFIIKSGQEVTYKTHLLSYTGRKFRFAYDPEKLYRFKNKFNPTWKTVYLCGYPKITLPGLLEMAYKSNYVKLIFVQLIKNLGIKSFG